MLWQKHCQKEFKVMKRETETWRELYIVSPETLHTCIRTNLQYATVGKIS